MHPGGARCQEPGTRNHKSRWSACYDLNSVSAFGGSDATLSWEFLARPLLDLAGRSFRRWSSDWGLRLSIEEQMALEVGVHPGLQSPNGTIEFAADFEQSTGSLGADRGATALSIPLAIALKG
jgi:hypothetical protein